MANRRGHRGFGTIRKLPSGRYQARYTGPDAILRSARTPSTPRRRRVLACGIRTRIQEGTWTPGRTAPTVARHWAPTPEGWLAARQLKARTREHYTHILDRLILPTFADLPLKAITPDLIRDWHTATAADTPTLRAHAYSLLRAIMRRRRPRRPSRSQPLPHPRRWQRQTCPQGQTRHVARTRGHHRRDARPLPGHRAPGLLVRIAVRRTDRTAPIRHRRAQRHHPGSPRCRPGRRPDARRDPEVRRRAP